MNRAFKSTTYNALLAENIFAKTSSPAVDQIHTRDESSGHASITFPWGPDGKVFFKDIDQTLAEVGRPEDVIF